MMAISEDSSSRCVLAAESPLLANLAALWRIDTALAQALEPLLDEPEYATEPSRAGMPTLALPTPDGRKLYLHSRHDPAGEAGRLVANLGGKGLYALHGLGLGYQLEALAEVAGDNALIVVVEPDLKLIRTALARRDFSKLLRRGRVIFITEADRGLLLGRVMPHQPLAAVGLELVSHAPSIQLHPEFHRQMQQWLTEFATYCRTSLQTLLLNGRRTAENLARNIAWYAAAPDLRRLRDRHAGRPAIIVSAGPSLRKNKHLLRQLRREGETPAEPGVSSRCGSAGASSSRAPVIIAVQTTLQPLLEMGIVPDYVTTLDYHDVSTRFFEKLPRHLTTELVAEPKASAAVLGMYPGPITLLGSDFCDKLLLELKPQKDRLRSGATVAHLAFYLAEYMGCDPIIFVGQDLAFTDGLCYAPGTSYEDVWRPELGRFCSMEMKQWEHIVRDRPILRKIEDWEGRPLYTEERLFSYLQQFERDFADSTRTIIDASEGGARKRGATPMTLAEALGKYCSVAKTATPSPGTPGVPGEGRGECVAGNPQDASWKQDACTRSSHANSSQILREHTKNDEGAEPNLHPGLNWQIQPQVEECLLRRQEEARQIMEIGRRTLPLLEEVRDHLEDAMRVNRAIAQIDLLRSEMFQLNHCYEMVTQLSQTTELERFQSDYAIVASKAQGTEKQRRQVERDMRNVQAVIDAAAQFEKLMTGVLAHIAARPGSDVSNLKSEI